MVTKIAQHYTEFSLEQTIVEQKRIDLYGETEAICTGLLIYSTLLTGGSIHYLF